MSARDERIRELKDLIFGTGTYPNPLPQVLGLLLIEIIEIHQRIDRLERRTGTIERA